MEGTNRIIIARPAGAGAKALAGFSLIELLVAVAVLGASLGSILALYALKRSTTAMAAPMPSEPTTPASIAI